MDYIATAYFGLFLSIFVIGLGIGILHSYAKEYLPEMLHRACIWYLKRTREPQWPERPVERARVNRTQIDRRPVRRGPEGTLIGFRAVGS